MSKNNEQPSQQKDSRESPKASGASNRDSLPLNKTPPAPSVKTTEANFTESHKGLTVLVQAERNQSKQEDEQ